VWDTALGDKPVHVLKHGTPIDEFHGDRAREDTGVKFCAWGTSLDRFYTGSSDGLIKVWNVRRSRGKDPFMRDLLEVPGPVSFGQFSPDRSRLIIGDATGRVSFLSVDEEDQKPGRVVELPNGTTMTGLPQLLIEHPDPASPVSHTEQAHHDLETGPERANAYLQRLQLVLTYDPTLGAVQGPNYAETGLYRKELHGNDDPTQPLVASQDILQQDARHPRGQEFVRRAHQFKMLGRSARLATRHLRNTRKDLDTSQLSEDIKEELRMAGAVVEPDFDFDYVEDVFENTPVSVGVAADG